MVSREISTATLVTFLLAFFTFSSGTGLCQDESIQQLAKTHEALPKFTIGGKGISTIDGIRIRESGGENINTSRVDFTDASLLLQFDTGSGSGARGGFLLGLQFPDPDVNMGTAFFHQVNAILDAGRCSIRIGRSGLETSLVMFPTLRDDDQIEYVYVRNAFSNSMATEHSQFGNMVKGDFSLIKEKLTVSAFGANLSETDRSGEVEDTFTLNSGGVQVNYELPAGVESEKPLRRLGATLFSQKVEEGSRTWMHAFIGGGVVDLNRDPVNHWDLRFQGIYNLGTDIVSVSSLKDQALASYVSLVASVRYLRSIERIARFQSALTLGYQNYPDTQASRFSIIPGFVYRLDNGVDLLAQIEYERYLDELEDSTGFRDRATVWIGLSYAFEMILNDHPGDRSSIFEREHRYIP